MPALPASPTDEDVAKRVQAGDTEAFGILVDRYEAKLLRYGRKFLSEGADIEDMVQEAFIRAFENIRSFDTKQRFSPWMYRIAHNAFVNALRSRGRTPLVFTDLDTLIPHAVHDDETEEAHDRERMKAAVEAGLDRLPPQYREVLILFFLEGLSYKEIADVLRVPVSTVGIRLLRARNRLKKELPDASHFSL